jgi:hypothetical protein
MSEDRGTPPFGALYRNPEGTLPMPSPGNDIPVAYYESAKLPLTWSLSNGLYSAKWQTPVFNLRPDLRSAGGSPKSGTPIWSTAARLYVQISNLVKGSIATTKGLRVTSTEAAAIAYGDVRHNFSSVERVTPSTEVTADVMFGTEQPDRVVLVFAPLGESRPVRFWSLALKFEKLESDWDASQVIYIASAYY